MKCQHACNGRFASSCAQDPEVIGYSAIGPEAIALAISALTPLGTVGHESRSKM
jgi:hypothetical protein